MIETSSLHKGIAGSRHNFVTLPPGRDKLDLLDDVGGEGDIGLIDKRGGYQLTGPILMA